MIDEYIDISVTCHLVVIVRFVKKYLHFCVFLGLLHIEEGRKNACIIFETLTMNIKKWILDFDKCVEFGSNRASIMIGKQNEVAAWLKEKINQI